MITFTDAWRRAAIHPDGTMTILAHKTSSIGWSVALPAPTRILHVDAGTLEFQPAGAHQVAALANLGHQLLQEIDAYRPGFLWTASPAEIVGALIEEIAPPTIEAKPQRATGEREAFDAWFGDTSKRGYVHNEVSAFSGWLAAKRALAAAPGQPVAVSDGDEAFKVAAQGCIFGNGDVARAAKEWFKAGYKAAPAVQGAGSAFARQLIDSDAENYIGEVFDTERGDIEVVARYVNGKTPPDKLAEMIAAPAAQGDTEDEKLKLDAACRAIELYADSYDRMGRISNNGKVDCTSVALDIRRNMIDAVRAATSARAQHPDDIAVDRFATTMKDKLAASRAKGRGGWDDPTLCSIEDLACMLCQHMLKGDPVDIGNFAMMLHQRDPEGEDAAQAIADASLTYLLIAPYPAAQADANDAARYRWLTAEQGLRYSPPGGHAIVDIGEMNAAIDAAISAEKEAS